MKVQFGPTKVSDIDGFKVAHGLGHKPSDVRINLFSLAIVCFQDPPYDGEYVYLVPSAEGVRGWLEITE